MTDWMNKVADEARRQGFGVGQTPKGNWRFSKGGHTWTNPGTPTTPTERLVLIGTLRAMGLDMPSQGDDQGDDQEDDQGDDQG